LSDFLEDHMGAGLEEEEEDEERRTKERERKRESLDCLILFVV